MFDYIVIGAGSAGCVLACRLTEDSHCKVLLLEAGPPAWNPYIHMPVGFYRLTGGKLTWGYSTIPQIHADNRVMGYSQGKVLGGSSSINGMVYTRGHPSDYDRWADQEGCVGWSYSEILPYFLRAERNNRFSGPYHGYNGPLGVSDQVHIHALSRLFVIAAQEFGLPHNPDFNSPDQIGAGLYQTTTLNGRRCSAERAYLLEARRRPNLRVVTGAFVRRLLVDGRRVTGVEYVVHGNRHVERCVREVILSAGAIGSPRLLLLSGIGPARHLQSVGIDVVHDLPGVGANLQDHVDVDTIYELEGASSYDKFKKPIPKLWAGVQYFAFRSGPASSSLVEAGAFAAVKHGTSRPDFQFHFLPGAGVEENTPGLDGQAGCTLNSYFLRPQSRGTVRLRNADPHTAPLIDPNYWAEPSDFEASLLGLEMSRDIMAQKPFARLISKEVLPGRNKSSSDELAAFLRAHGRTAYHPVGTCRMGVGMDAVVAPDLRMHGLEGLRIVDASVMPSLIGSNTNAATIMIAEKASDLIRGRAVSVEAKPRLELAETHDTMQPME